MKKFLISLLIILTIVTSSFAYATELTNPSQDLDDNLGGTPTPTPTATVTATAVVTSSPTPSPTPVKTPSVDAPFSFSVATADGKTDIIQGEVQDLKLTFKVVPNGTEDFTLTKIVNKDTGTSYDIKKDISKTDSVWTETFKVSFNPTDNNKSVTFELQWEDFSGNKDRKTTAIFKVNVAAPMLTIAVTPVNAIVPGAPITVKYHVQNTGNVTLKNVLIQDPTAAYLNNDIIFSPEEFLVPGAMFEREATITLDGEATLSPSVTFWYKEDSYTVKGTELLLTAQEVIPTITLTCDSYTVAFKGASHLFRYTITNNTQVNLTDIYVYDGDGDDAGVVNGPFNLAVGETYNGTYEIPIYKSGYFKFKIHYAYEGAEAEKKQFAKTDLPLRLPNEVFFDIVRVTPEQISEPGEMVFILLIENGTAYDLNNVAIEEEYGLFNRIELNKPVSAASGNVAGQHQEEIRVNVPAETKVIQFNLHYMINGELSIINTSYDNIFTAVTTTPEITVTPSAIPTPQIIEDNDDNGLGFWIWILVFLLILLIILVIILIFIKGKNSNPPEVISVKRKMKDAFDDFDYDEYADLDDSELDALLNEAELAENSANAVPLGTTEVLDNEESNGQMHNVTAAILSPDEPIQTKDLNEEFSTEFDDEVDDEGVKIFKGKK